MLCTVEYTCKNISKCVLPPQFNRQSIWDNHDKQETRLPSGSHQRSTNASTNFHRQCQSEIWDAFTSIWHWEDHRQQRMILRLLNSLLHLKYGVCLTLAASANNLVWKIYFELRVLFEQIKCFSFLWRRKSAFFPPFMLQSKHLEGCV